MEPVRDRPARSAILLNRCITRAHSVADARQALRDLGYDVLSTAVPRLEVYAQSFGLPIPDTGSDVWRGWPAISSPGAPSRARCGRDPTTTPVQDCAVHAEEIGGEHRGGLRVQELPPGRVGASLRCGRDLQRLEHPADRGRADPVAEFQQFALDPLVSPAVVVGGEPLDQSGDLGADWRPSCAMQVGPVAGDQAAVPAQDGAGGDQPVGSQLAGRSRVSAVRTARSAQSRRGRGLVRRSTATSCRSTSSSA